MLKLRSLIEAAPLGDTRRNERLYELLAALATGDAVRLSKRATWAHAMGSYRFFDNDAVSLVALYSIVHQAIRALIQPHTRVYIAHDPSILDYSGHSAKADRVEVGDHQGLGYELFTALVLDSAGRPLGPVFQEVRTAKGCYSSEPTPGRRPARPARFVGNIEQMEKAVGAAQKHLPDVERVHVADCEFDDIALQRLIQQEPEPEHKPERYVLRAQHLHRKVLHQAERCSLQEVADQVPLRRGSTIERDGIRYRRFAGETHVVFDGKSYRGRHRGQTPTSGPAIEVRVIVVELRARGQKPIRWVLLTNLKDPLWDVVQAYLYRWKVERYFYLTKAGFRLEAWTQQTGERLARRLVVSSLAAMIIYQLFALKDEPEGIETLQWIATQGGWLGRKRDPIGPIVLMRGMLRILDGLALIKHYGLARIQAIAEQIFPGITQEIQKSGARKNV